MRHIVIADPDGEYIKGCEEEILAVMPADADLQVITDRDYLINYFRVFRSIDALVIGAQFCGPYLEQHDIKHMLILDTGSLVGVDDSEIEKKLMNYVNHNNIPDFITNSLENTEDVDPLDQDIPYSGFKTICVYSPIGGCGKSLTAVALAKKLKRLEEKVVLIGCDDWQNMGVFLENRDTADPQLASLLKKPSEETYWMFLKNIYTGEVPVLLPFERPLPELGIGADQLIDLVDLIEQKRDFDIVILDLGSAFSEETRDLINRSDVCITINEPNLNSCRKMEKFGMNFAFRPETEQIMLSNQYHSEGFNIGNEKMFGAIPAYSSAAEAMEDPVFYSLALKMTE